MSKPKMWQFMGDKKSQKESEVQVTIDPSVIRKPKPQSNIDDDEQLQGLGNKMANMALSSSMGKDERKFKLEALFDQHEVFTVTAASKALGVSYNTAKTYAKELHISILDDKNQKWLEGRTPLHAENPPF